MHPAGRADRRGHRARRRLPSHARGGPGLPTAVLQGRASALPTHAADGRRLGRPMASDWILPCTGEASGANTSSITGERPEKAFFWRFRADVTVPDDRGVLIEVPIFTRQEAAWKLLTAKRVGLQRTGASSGADGPEGPRPSGGFRPIPLPPQVRPGPDDEGRAEPDDGAPAQDRPEGPPGIPSGRRDHAYQGPDRS